MDLKKQKVAVLKGFSFMEVMIVVAIIALMSTVAITSLIESRNRKQLETEARKFVAVIREAQNNSLAGKNLGTVVSPKYPCSFGVEVSEEGMSEYKLFYRYKTNIASGCDSGTTYESLGNYSLENGAVFSFPSQVPVPFVEFSVPFGMTNWDTNGLQVKKDENNVRVCICRFGKIIEDYNPNPGLCSSSECAAT